MNVKCKSIDTDYNGYLFRSRLEARWAVFLDSLGFTYEYEPEGYDLPRHGWYLPDFWVPSLKCFIEIKPSSEPWVYPGYLAELCEMTNKYTLLVRGTPGLGTYGLLLFEGNGNVDSVPFMWGDQLNPYAMRFATGRKDDRELYVEFDESGYLCLNTINDSDRWPLHDSPKLLMAYKAARSARFEHGHKMSVYE